MLYYHHHPPTAQLFWAQPKNQVRLGSGGGRSDEGHMKVRLNSGSKFKSFQKKNMALMRSQLVQFYCCVYKKVLLHVLFTSQRSDLIKGVLCPAAVLALQCASGQNLSLALETLC